jgi:hypothetical protein
MSGGIIGLENQPNSATLEFNRSDDSFDFVGHCLEDGGSWGARHNVDILNRYEKGDLDIVLKVNS